MGHLKKWYMFLRAEAVLALLENYEAVHCISLEELNVKDSLIPPDTDFSTDELGLVRDSSGVLFRTGSLKFRQQPLPANHPSRQRRRSSDAGPNQMAFKRLL